MLREAARFKPSPPPTSRIFHEKLDILKRLLNVPDKICAFFSSHDRSMRNHVDAQEAHIKNCAALMYRSAELIDELKKKLSKKEEELREANKKVGDLEDMVFQSGADLHLLDTTAEEEPGAGEEEEMEE